MKRWLWLAPSSAFFILSALLQTAAEATVAGLSRFRNRCLIGGCSLTFVFDFWNSFAYFFRFLEKPQKVELFRHLTFSARCCTCFSKYHWLIVQTFSLSVCLNIALKSRSPAIIANTRTCYANWCLC